MDIPHDDMKCLRNAGSAMNILSISAIVLTILLSSYTTAESLEVANITVYVIGQCINSLRLQQMQYNELNKVYSDFDAKTILIVLFLGVIVIYKILPPNKKEKYKPYFRWLVEKFEFLLDPKSAIKKFKRSLDKQKGDIAKDETVVNHPSKVPEDGLCSKCFGKGKVKCDCLNVRVTVIALLIFASLTKGITFSK